MLGVEWGTSLLPPSLPPASLQTRLSSHHHTTHHTHHTHQRQHGARQVSWQEGADFAQRHGCLFVETSAKQNIAVGVAFEELVLR